MTLYGASRLVNCPLSQTRQNLRENQILYRFMNLNITLSRRALTLFWIQLLVVLGSNAYVERSYGVALMQEHSSDLVWYLIAPFVVLRCLLYAEVGGVFWVLYRSKFRIVFFRENADGRLVPSGMAIGLGAAIAVFLFLFGLAVRR